MKRTSLAKRIGSRFVLILIGIGMIGTSALWSLPARGQVSIPNTVQLAFQNQVGINRGSTSNTTILTVNPVAGLELTAAATPNPVAAGSTLTYTLDYRNNGNVDLTGVVATLRLPPTTHVEFISLSPVGTMTGDTITFNIGPLNAGISGRITVVVRVLDYVPNGTALLADAIIDSNETSPLSEQINVIATNDKVVKLDFTATVAPDPVEAGNILTYFLNYHNSGDLDLTGVNVSLKLPPQTQIEFKSSHPITGTFAGDTIGFSIGDLKADSSAFINVSVKVLESVPTGTNLQAVATIYSNQTPPLSQPLQVMVINRSLPLRVTIKPDRELIEVGDFVIFTVTVENLGTQGDLNNVELYTTPPKGFRPYLDTIHVDGEPAPASNHGNQILIPLGYMGAKQVITIHYRAVSGAGALGGDGIARAWAEIMNILSSNMAQCRVTVTSFAEKGTIIGKVFVDENQDRIQNNGEPGFPGVSIFMENGIHVVTDTQGKYSIPQVPPGLHVVQIDKTTLPAWAVPSTINTRFASNPLSQFVEIKGGGLYKANFRVLPYPGVMNTQAVIDERHTRITLHKKAVVHLEPNGTEQHKEARPRWHIDFSLNVSSRGGATIHDLVLVDRLPSGIEYKEGTSYLDGQKGIDPVINGNTLTWDLPDYNGQNSSIITFQAELRQDATPGTYPNRAWVRFRLKPDGDLIISRPAIAPVEVTFPSETVKLFFDTARAKIRPDAEDEIDRISKFLNNYPESEIFIEGHADIRPIQSRRFASNQELSETRAKAVAQFLTGEKDIDQQRIKITGYGARNPIAPNDTSENLQLNRRVEVNMGMFVMKSGQGVSTTNIVVPSSPLSISEGEVPAKLLEKDSIVFNTEIIPDSTSRLVGMEIRHRLYPGSSYKKGSSRLNAMPVPDPQNEEGELVWVLKNLEPTGKADFTYSVVMEHDEITTPPPPFNIIGLTENGEKIVGNGRVVNIIPAPPGSALPGKESKGVETPRDSFEQIRGRIDSMEPTLEILAPAEGEAVGHNQIRVLVKGKALHTFYLSVDDREVGLEHVGEVVHSNKSKTVILEYVAVTLKPGKNTITATAKDGFGIKRGKVVRTIILTDKPQNIGLVWKETDLAADGKAEAEIVLTLTDKFDQPVKAANIVTVAASTGKVLDEDQDRHTPGIQLKVKNGMRVIHLQAPVNPADAKVQAALGELEAEVTVPFLPHLREMIIVAMGEGTLGYRDVKSSLEPIGPDDGFEDGLFTKGRMSLFLKGKVKGKYLLTAAYDSDGNLPNLEKKRDIDPEKYYPVYGDSSVMDFEAQSTEKLYIKIERDRSHVLFGDFDTSLTENSLVQWDRVVTGVQVRLEDKERKQNLKAFASEVDRRLAVDDLSGKGISGYYYLSETPVVPGSEKIEIQVRDRDDPNRVINKTKMRRNENYVIDNVLGTIMFREPIPAEDDNFNPVMIHVVYEVEHGEAGYYHYGIQGEKKVLEDLTIGGTMIRQQLKGGDDYQMTGAHAEIGLPGKTKLRIEGARTDDAIKGVGDALKATIDSNPHERVSIRGSAYRTTETFQNPLSTIKPDQESADIKAEVKLSSKLKAMGRYFYNKDKAAHQQRNSAEVGVEADLGKAKVGTGVRSLDNEYGSFKTGKAWASANITEKLGARIEYEQAFDDPSINVTTAGMDYRLQPATRVFIKQQIISSPDGFMGFSEDHRRELFVAGIESNLTQNTSLFGRYEIDDAISGRDAFARIGFNHRLILTKDITADLRLERRESISGPGMLDFTAISVGCAYLPVDSVKINGNVEMRWGEDETSRMARGGAIIKLGPDWSLLARETYFERESAKGDARSVRSKFGIGLAYRPVGYDSINLLWRLQHVLDDNDTGGLISRSERVVGMVDLHYNPVADLELAARYAHKLVIEDSLGKIDESFLDYVSAGVLYDLNPKWRVGMNGRLLRSPATSETIFSYGADLGHEVYQNIWLTTGYNLQGFEDEDFSINDYTAQGPYLRIQIKMDQDTRPW